MNRSAFMKNIRHAPVGAFWNNEPSQVLLEAASQYDLKQLLKKQAATRDIPAASVDFEVRPGHSYLLTISLGSGDWYGANENGDHYNEAEKNVIFPEPVGPPTIRLGKGLKDTHATFKSHAGVFKHHQALLTHKVQPSGKIVWERYNPKMHWGELVLELPQDKWQAELDAHSRGTPMMWSQGSGVPIDWCSRCGFGFTAKSKQRCHHILFRKLCVEKDGIQNFIYCPDAWFHDYSYVGNEPADKMAFGLLKLASTEVTTARELDSLGGTGSVVPVHITVTELKGLGAPGLSGRSRAFDSLRESEKTVSDEEVGNFLQTFGGLPEEDADFVDVCRSMEGSELIPALNSLEIVLTPSQFYRIFVPDGEPVGVSGFTQELSGIFNRAADGNCGDILKSTDFVIRRTPSYGAVEKLRPFSPLFSSNPGRRRRNKVIVLKAAGRIGRPSPAETTPQQRYLAESYAGYQLASLSAMQKYDRAGHCILLNRAGL